MLQIRGLRGLKKLTGRPGRAEDDIGTDCCDPNLSQLLIGNKIPNDARNMGRHV